MVLLPRHRDRPALCHLLPPGRASCEDRDETLCPQLLPRVGDILLTPWAWTKRPFARTRTSAGTGCQHQPSPSRSHPTMSRPCHGCLGSKQDLSPRGRARVPPSCPLSAHPDPRELLGRVGRAPRRCQQQSDRAVPAESHKPASPPTRGSVQNSSGGFGCRCSDSGVLFSFLAETKLLLPKLLAGEHRLGNASACGRFGESSFTGNLEFLRRPPTMQLFLNGSLRTPGTRLGHPGVVTTWAMGTPHPGTFSPNPKAGLPPGASQPPIISWGRLHPAHGEDAEPRAKDNVSKRLGTWAVKTMSPTRLSPASRYRAPARRREEATDPCSRLKPLCYIVLHFAHLSCAAHGYQDLKHQLRGLELDPPSHRAVGPGQGAPGHRRGHFGLKSSIFCAGSSWGQPAVTRGVLGVMP